MAVTQEEIRVRASVNVQQAERELSASLERASRRISAALSGSTSAAFKKVAQDQEKAQQELVRKRRKLIIEAIQDERERELQRINFTFDEERKRIERLLKLRLEAGEITKQQFRESVAEFDRLLDESRQKQVQRLDAPQGFIERFRKIGGVAGAALGLGVGVGLSEGLRAARRGLDETIGEAIRFEEQMIAVRKTTELNTRDLNALGDELLRLSVRLGQPVEGLTEISAIAGQLGIRGVENIAAFTEATAQLAGVTDFDVSSGADAIARISNVFDIAITDANRLGSALNELENTTTANAPKIADFILSVGSSAEQLGITADQVAAIGATLIDAGLEVSVAGTSFRNTLTRIRTEGERLAPILNITRQEFDQLVREEPIEALSRLLSGLEAMDPVLRDIEIREVFGERSQRAILALLGLTEELNTNLETANRGFAEGTSLQSEFERTLDAAGKQWEIFTARVEAGAIAAGRRALPAITSLLTAVNSLGRSAEEITRSYQSLNAEIENTRAVDELIRRYEELSARGLERTSEETEELRRITARLTEQYPQYISATRDATGEVVIYTDALRGAVAQQRALAIAQRGVELRTFAREFGETAQRVETLRASQERINQAIERGDGLVRGAGGAYITLRDQLEGVSESLIVAESRMNSFARSIAATVDVTDGLSLLALKEDLIAAIGSVEEAEPVFSALVVALQELRAAAEDADGTKVEIDFDFGDLSLEEVRARIDAVKRELESLDGAANPQVQARLEAELNALLARERAILAETAEGTKKLQEQASKAAEDLVEKDRDLRIQAIDDEHERRLEAIDLQFQREREAIEALLNLRLRAGQITRAEFDAQLDAFSSALDAAQQRTVADLNARREEAERRLRERQEREELETQERIEEARTDIALAELEVRQRAEREALQRIAEEQLTALEERVRLEEQRITQSFDARVQAAEAAHQAEIRRIEREVEDRTEAELAIKRAGLDRTNAIAEAEERRMESMRELYESLAKEMERRTEQLARTLESHANNIAGIIRHSIAETRQFTDTDIELTRLRFQQEEDALKESLREREISQQEYSLRVRQLAEDRAEFEKEVERDKASTISRIIDGLTGLLIEEAIRLTVRLAAEAVARQVIAATSLAATVASVQTAMSAIAASAGAAAGAVSIASFGAAAATGTAAALTGIAAVKAATIAATGFEKGGYTGDGRRNDEAGIVHKGEFVLTKQAVRGRPKPFYALMQALEGGLTPEDLEEWLKERGFGPSLRAPRIRASQAAAVVGLPGFATGGFVDTSAALVPAPVSDASSRSGNRDVIHAIQGLGDRIESLEVRLEVGRRVQSEIVKGGAGYQSRKAVRNRFRRHK